MTNTIKHLITFYPTTKNIEFYQPQMRQTGIGKREAEVLEGNIRKLFALVNEREMFSYTITFSKSRIRGSVVRQCKLFGNHTAGLQKELLSFDVTKTFFFIPNKNNKGIKEFIVLTNKVVEKGSTTAVKIAFSVSSGNAFVKKKSQDSVEKEIKDELFEHRGHISEIYYRSVANKFQQIEPRYADDLLNGVVLEKVPYSSGVSIAKDLLSGLVSLHNLTKKCSHRDPFFLRNVTVNSKVFHSDIKLENILYRQNKEKNYEAIWSDISFKQGLFGSMGTPPFFPPEKTVRKKKYGVLENQKEIIENHQKYGQMGDMWCMGFVLFQLLTRNIKEGKEEHQFVDWLELELPAAFFTTRGKLDLTQEQIDQLISNGKKHVTERLTPYKNGANSQWLKFDALWRLVKKMLRVNPDERITAKQALEELERAGSK